MANLWQFFGLPDPDGPDKSDKKKRKIPEDHTVRPEPIIDKPIQSGNAPSIVEKRTWRGPITPDGEKFHDMALSTNKNTEPSEVERGLRYVVPDGKHRLPLEGMQQRLNEGDVLVVDLRNLIHMDAHQNACRRLLRELADSMKLPAFSLDEEERILLMPGIGITIDINNHPLGLAPMIS